MSDDFERKYNDSLNSSGCLGATNEGHKWLRRDYQGNGADIHSPGVLESNDGNKALIWKGGCLKTDIIYSTLKVKNFKLEFDYLYSGKFPLERADIVNFRMNAPDAVVSDAEKPAGYALHIVQKTQESLKLQLRNNYGLEKNSTEIYIGKPGGHIKIIAIDDNIKVYINEILALDVTDGTNNPSKDEGGYFSLQFNIWDMLSWLDGKHGIDNWRVSTL
jgi:hypothetical protein